MADHLGKSLTKKGLRLQKQRSEAYHQAIGAVRRDSVAPTIATIFRDLEWEWLDILDVKLKDLLHSEQEYEFFAAFPVDEEFELKTTLKKYRERVAKGVRMRWVTVATEVIVSDKTHVCGTTAFIVREAVEEAK